MLGGKNAVDADRAETPDSKATDNGRAPRLGDTGYEAHARQIVARS